MLNSPYVIRAAEARIARLSIKLGSRLGPVHAGLQERAFRARPGRSRSRLLYLVFADSLGGRGNSRGERSGPSPPGRVLLAVGPWAAHPSASAACRQAFQHRSICREGRGGGVETSPPRSTATRTSSGSRPAATSRVGPPWAGESGQRSTPLPCSHLVPVT